MVGGKAKVGRCWEEMGCSGGFYFIEEERQLKGWLQSGVEDFNSVGEVGEP